MPLTLTPLGRVSGMPKAGSAASGYLVSDGVTTVLLDAGPGVALALSGQLAIDRLDAVIITHLHIDHVHDALAVAKMILAARMRMGADGIEVAQTDRIPFIVPQGGADRLRTLAALFPVVSNPIFDQAFDLAAELFEYQPGDRLQIGSLDLNLIELVHVVTNCGIRVTSDDGRVIAYTGDTGWTPALLDLARDADLLVCETTFLTPDTSNHGHLCAAQAGQAAAESGAKTLMLTHFTSLSDDHLETCLHQAGEHFAGPITIAEPGVPTTIN